MNKRKNLSEQVVVLTGASSGIGAVTAKMLAARGARVVLASRNEADLDWVASEIREKGGECTVVPVDVSDRAQVELLADRAIAAYGRIDTWINNAAVLIHARIEDVSLEDARRLFDIDFWGQVHGSLVALEHLRDRGGGLINVASAEADRPIPLHGSYSAAKHAVKAFTGTLRMELEAAKVPISVTLVKPSAIDTPLFEKSLNAYDREPRPMPPVYAPEVVAKAIVQCCERPRRDVVVGSQGKFLSILDAIAPRLGDRAMERLAMENSQLSDIRVGEGRVSNLHQPIFDDGGERGHTWNGRVRRTSLYTRLTSAPLLLVGALALFSAPLLARALRSRGPILERARRRLEPPRAVVSEEYTATI